VPWTNNQTLLHRSQRAEGPWTNSADLNTLFLKSLPPLEPSSCIDVETHLISAHARLRSATSDPRSSPVLQMIRRVYDSQIRISEGLMCKIFVRADPTLYETTTRSMRLHGVVTSIRLENLVWRVLGEIGQRDGMGINRLITKLYDEVVEARGGVRTSHRSCACVLPALPFAATPGRHPRRRLGANLVVRCQCGAGPGTRRVWSLLPGRSGIRRRYRNPSGNAEVWLTTARIVSAVARAAARAANPLRGQRRRSARNRNALHKIRPRCAGDFAPASYLSCPSHRFPPDQPAAGRRPRWFDAAQ
jgi:predicted DNA-binding ribbon-helix-helix protein